MYLSSAGLVDRRCHRASLRFTHIRNILKRLSPWFDFIDTALLWIQFYLSSRSFFAKTSEASSRSYPLTCGVPQGSVLAPLLLIDYHRNTTGRHRVYKEDFLG